MSKKSGGTLNMILNLLASFLLVFSVIGTYGSYIGKYLTSSPDFCISQIEESEVAQKVYDSLKLKFDGQFGSTGIPSDVYLNTITPEWIEEAMKGLVMVSYSQLGSSSELVYFSADYTALEASVTQYFEQYAEENNYEKDTVYDEKLKQTIKNAETMINDAVDIYKMETMKKANIWSKVGKVSGILETVFPVCIAVTVVISIILVILKNPVYWIGTSLFADGIILTLPSVWVLSSNVIMSFSIKEVSIYTVVTGAMTAVTEMVMTAGTVMLSAGLLMIIAGIIINRLKK